MRCVVQRVTKASVTVDNEIVGKIDNGFMVLVGAEEGDTSADAAYCAEKSYVFTRIISCAVGLLLPVSLSG